LRCARRRQRTVGALDDRVISRYNGKPSLNIGVDQAAVANPLELLAGRAREVVKINENLPSGMKLIVAYDTSVFIDRSISSVFETIVEAIVLGRAGHLLLPAQPARDDHSRS
jgi:multidrug efflux pump